MIAELEPLRPSPPREGVVDRDNPWPGLAAFREGESEFFHGRSAAIDELHRRVLRERLTVLFGLSGLGKTSLLQAGLFPILREENYLPVLVRLDFTAGAPCLVAQVQDALVREAEEVGVETPAARPGESLWEYLHRPDHELWSPRNRLLTPVVVFDQFEEIFTLGRGRAELAPARESFLTELADLVEGRPPARLQARLEEDPEAAGEFDFQRHPYKVLLTLREDFLPDLEALRARMPSLTHNRMRLLRMSGEEALTVVTGAGGHLVEAPVAEKIVRFVSGAGDAGGTALAELTTEPALLSVVCRELNLRRQQRGEHRITSDLLDGDRNEILTDFYERGVSDLTSEARRFLEERLLTASGYRDSVAIEDALAVPALSREAIDLLVSRRLLRIEERGGVPRIELTHDVLTGVVRGSRDARREREARDAAESARREAEERELVAAAKLRRSRIVSVVLAASLILALVAGIWAMVAERNARQAQINASYETARSLAEEGVNSRAESLAFLASVLRLDPGHEPARYLMDDLLLRRAWALPRLVLPHDDALVGAIASEDGETIVTLARAGEAYIWDGQTGRRRGEPLRHASRIVTAAVTLDGTRVVTADLDGEARIWSAADGRPVGDPMRHDDLVVSTDFTADGQRVVTTSRDGTAQLWEAATGRPVGEPLRHDDQVWFLQVSRYSDRFATGSDDGVVRVWEAATGQAVGAPIRHDSEVLWDLDLSPDGSRVLTITDSRVRLWEAETGRLQEELALPKWVAIGRFSPDGRSIGFANRDGAAFAWDIGSSEAFGLDVSHGAAVTSLEFSSDGRRLLTVSADDTANLWDVETGVLLGQPLRHGATVSTARFSSSDGLAVVTASADGTARIWDLRIARGDGYPLDREPDGWISMLDPDGRNVLVRIERGGEVLVRAYEVASGSPLGPAIPVPGWPLQTYLSPGGRIALLVIDGTGYLWNTSTGSAIGEPLVHDDGAITSARASADGRLAVTLSRGGSARVWNLATAELVGALPPEPSKILDADFDPRGERLATGHEKGSIRLWELPALTRATDQPVEHDLSVASVRFLSDRLLFGAAPDGELWLSDLETGERSREVMRHDSWVLDADLSPDGRRLVTASDDGTVRVWTVPEGVAVGSPIRLGYSVVSVQVSADGRRLLTTDLNGRTRQWHAGTGAPLGLPVSHGAGHGAALGTPSGYRISDARFLPDGPGWVTAAWDGTAITWSTTLGLADDVEALADLAEAVAGFEVDEDGVLQPIRDPASRLRNLRARAEKEDLPFVRWYLSDPWRRTITPSLEVTAEDYIRRRLAAMETRLQELPADRHEAYEDSVRAELETTFPGFPLLRRAEAETEPEGDRPGG